MICIRKGTKADISAALQLVKELAVYEKAPDEVEVTVDEMTNWGFGSDKQFDFFVALENEVIVGLALYYFKYSTWKGKCLFLEDIIVTEPKRGKGIGKLLFDQVVQVSKELKVRRMEWQVLNWNTPAIEFYKKYDATLDEEWVNCKLTDRQLETM
ncbi:MAG: N-acetyltransferase [Bacteroidota bacterium]|jgi:GNAT superfamily N-acetyltransferase|nr:N-acetyltransferase [Bacteroidota bacterium]